MSASTYAPELYDLFHDEDARDVRWYVERAKASGGPVLELGAGTGRTLLPVARAGVAITGLEIDGRMRAALEDKLAREPEQIRVRVEVVAGDMRSFSIDAQFAMIQIPFRAFLHNLDRDAQLACLRACLAHLCPGGVLALNVFHPSLRVMSANQGQLEGVWRWREERLRPDGCRVVWSDMTVYHPARQQLTARLRYEVFDSDGWLQSTFLNAFDLAYLYPGDVRELLAAAGFDRVRIDGGFDGRPHVADGDELVVTAHRPDA